MIKNLFVKGLYASLVLVAIFMGFIFYWVNDDTPPFISRFVNTNKDTYHPGEMVVGTFMSRGLRVCRTKVVRYLNDLSTPYDDAIVVSVSDRDSNGSTGGLEKAYVIRFYLPPDLPKGTYSIYARVYYACNPLQRVFGRSMYLDLKTIVVD